MLAPSLGWNVEPIGFVESGVGFHPAIAPRPKDVSDTVVQNRLGGRDVAPCGADLPVLQAHPVGLLPAIGPRPKASAQLVRLNDSREPRKLSIERPSSNRKSKIDNRKFPGGFMIPWQEWTCRCHSSSCGAPQGVGFYRRLMKEMSLPNNR